MTTEQRLKWAKGITGELRTIHIAIAEREGLDVLPVLILAGLQEIIGLWMTLDANTADTEEGLRSHDHLRNHLLQSLETARMIIASANPLVAVEALGVGSVGTVKLHMSPHAKATMAKPKATKKKGA